MSGGYFNYWQHHIDRIADDAQHVIGTNMGQLLERKIYCK